MRCHDQQSPNHVDHVHPSSAVITLGGMFLIFPPDTIEFSEIQDPTSWSPKIFELTEPTTTTQSTTPCPSA